MKKSVVVGATLLFLVQGFTLQANAGVLPWALEAVGSGSSRSSTYEAKEKAMKRLQENIKRYQNECDNDIGRLYTGEPVISCETVNVYVTCTARSNVTCYND